MVRIETNHFTNPFDRFGLDDAVGCIYFFGVHIRQNGCKVIIEDMIAEGDKVVARVTDRPSLKKRPG